MSEACQAEEYTQYIKARLATPASRTLSISRSQSEVSGMVSKGGYVVTAIVVAVPSHP